MARKKKKIEQENWVEESTEVIKEEKPKKKRSSSYSKTKGSTYERKIVNELKELTGDQDLCTSRSDSKKLDDMKIDISDINNTLTCYIQCKSTQNTPSVKKINDEVGKKDKPLCILWNIQEKKEVNICSAGEYAIIPKSYFYELLLNQIDKNKEK